MDCDYISRQAAIEAIEELQLPIMRSESNYMQFMFAGLSNARAEIANLPPADVKPVVRGEWLYTEDVHGQDGFMCNQCGHTIMWDYKEPLHIAEKRLPNFCPNCGADMRGESDGNN